ncbi:MAG TPA: YkvA family protein [Verrucomicrobiae bacterium]|nr:YkvA family protein [Verrucomicrobiae bacterium]
MSEIVEFVHHGAAQITPKILRGVHKKLPFLKMEFTQINAPKYPHLVEQLEFLADVVEDFAEGAEDDLPFVALASAVFALIYAHRQKDLIPDFVPDFGHADESAVVRAVLIEHEKVLADYATRHHRNWTRISVKP